MASCASDDYRIEALPFGVYKADISADFTNALR
jgi:hypothetical protein